MHSLLPILLFTFFSFWLYQPFVEPQAAVLQRLAKPNFGVGVKNAFQYGQNVFAFPKKTFPEFSNSVPVQGKKTVDVKFQPIRTHQSPNLAAPKNKPNQTLTKNTVVNESTLPIKSALNWSNKFETVREYLKVFNEKAKFGLDKVPKNGVYIPKVVHEMENGKRKTMAKMLTYTGRALYNGLWKASSAIQKIPNPYRGILFLFALIPDLVHTADEYFQVFLLSYSDPDQVGVGMPKNPEEFAVGLNNLWWDAWPDFAFGVPQIFFGANPPLLLLKQAYKTMFEYVGKKVLGEFLKDLVWTSEIKPIKWLKKYTEEHFLPKGKVFEGDKREGEEWNDEGEITIDEALLRSQKDSNLDKYFALNSMRACYVILMAVAFHAEFFKELDNVPDEELSEFAKNVKTKMDENPETKQKSKTFLSEMVNGEEMDLDLDLEVRKALLKANNQFEEEFEPTLENNEVKKSIEKLGEIGEEMKRKWLKMAAKRMKWLEMGKRMKFLKIAKRTAQFIIFKDEKVCELKNEEEMEEEEEDEKEEIEILAKDLANGILNAFKNAFKMDEMEETLKEEWNLGEDYIENETKILPKCSAKVRNFLHKTEEMGELLYKKWMKVPLLCSLEKNDPSPAASPLNHFKAADNERNGHGPQVILDGPSEVNRTKKIIVPPSQPLTRLKASDNERIGLQIVLPPLRHFKAPNNERNGFQIALDGPSEDNIAKKIIVH